MQNNTKITLKFNNLSATPSAEEYDATSDAASVHRLKKIMASNENSAKRESREMSFKGSRP